MMSHNQDKVFISGGLESASSIVASGILTSSWKLIFDLNAETHNNSNQNLFWKKVSNDSGLTMITFGTAQNHFQPDHLHPFSIDEDDNLFKFICSKTNPSFSLNEYVFSLFNAYLAQLLQLKSEIDLKRPVIVTGHGVGGSIASLFTLLLLEKVDPTKDKRPLCITFGSPLIADQNFHQAMSQGSNWNSCFLHVASLQDPFLIFSSSLPNNSYSPFGIFLMCSDYGSSCFENPFSVLRLLNLMSQLNHQGLQNWDYGRILDNLNRKAICRDPNGSNIRHSDLFQESLELQLCALGFPQLQEINMNNLAQALQALHEKEVSKQKKRFDPNKRLNKMKEKMARLEWYKKDSKREGKGYYDRFKKQSDPPSISVMGFIKELNIYWEEMVKEAEKQPQKEGASFRTRWLYAGTNYRRMVEPLDIANYYNEGKRDYINQGRPEQYKQLEKWLNDDQRAQPRISVTKNVESILTLDSCFWAHVEEALILCEKIKAVGYGEAEKREAMNGLDAFEKYVYESLKNYAVSPEIFLGGSSFMTWWGKYIGMKGASYGSEFANFMKNPSNYKMYKEGAYIFP